MRPSIPPMPKSGRNTATTISVAKAIGRPTSIAAASVRARRSSAPAPARRCSTFSVTMIAASTSSPTAIARPPSVMVLMPTPRGRSSSPESATESGIVSVTIAAARALPRSANRTAATKTPPSSTARPTPPSAVATSCDWSYTTRSVTPFGSVRRTWSIASRIAAATLTVSAPNCLLMRQLTTSPASRCASPRRGAGASTTSATSASSTGAMPRATTVRRRSSTPAARPTARTLHSVEPRVRKPAAAFSLAPSSA